jgi:indole-3-glycerol phosphate synthase
MTRFLPIALGALLLAAPSTAFSPVANRGITQRTTIPSTTTTTSLNAIGVLARKAKENEIRQYVEGGIPDSVMEKVVEMKKNLESVPSIADRDATEPGPVQEGLTKRKGTISIIAEYKKTFVVKSGFADDMFDPEVMSPVFREFGARAVAVLADERMGGCTYDDLEKISKEQASAKGDMPGPCPVISSDLIVDELQIAMSAASGAEAVLITYDVAKDKTGFFIDCAKAVGLEAVVGVSTKEEAQIAIDAGARMISITGVDDVDDKVACIADLEIPKGAQVLTIAVILANDNKALEEVEEAWVCRDKGFNAVWVSDCLYKSGNDPSEHAGAIIRGMAAKSSVKWASAKAMGGKGEGAREYLGDIMM